MKWAVFLLNLAAGGFAGFGVFGWWLAGLLWQGGYWYSAAEVWGFRALVAGAVLTLLAAPAALNRLRAGAVVTVVGNTLCLAAYGCAALVSPVGGGPFGPDGFLRLPAALLSAAALVAGGVAWARSVRSGAARTPDRPAQPTRPATDGGS